MEFLRDENGQGMVEYALIIALISIAALGILAGIGTAIARHFTDVEGALNGAGTGGSGT